MKFPRRFGTVAVAVFAYTVSGPYLELTATGFVSADEAQSLFRTIRADPAVPEGLPYLMDLRQYDQNSMSLDELQPRVQRMFEILGPKIGPFWAVVIDTQVEHAVKARFLQHLVHGDAATVMIFAEIDDAREWLTAMAERLARKRQA